MAQVLEWFQDYDNRSSVSDFPAQVRKLTDPYCHNLRQQIGFPLFAHSMQYPCEKVVNRQVVGKIYPPQLLTLQMNLIQKKAAHFQKSLNLHLVESAGNVLG